MLAAYLHGVNRHVFICKRISIFCDLLFSVETWLTEIDKIFTCGWFLLKLQLFRLKNNDITSSIRISADSFLYEQSYSGNVLQHTLLALVFSLAVFLKNANYISSF